MTASDRNRFIFLGGIPVFDYMIELSLKEICRVIENDLIMIDDKMLLPLGTIFVFRVEGQDKLIHVNPMAACEAQKVNEKYYYTMTFGGKHSERPSSSLRSDKLSELFGELNRAYPEIIRDEKDLKLIMVEKPARIQ
ncbi:MAG: hypothetical protein U9Q39_07595, partial [Pseudomonadota bacterium]|nr:hypothetical protein [Pseudomonadota bacterium]